MVRENLCPVCGFGMEDPPRDYNICPSCGTEFGVHDLNSSIENLRMVWLKNGAKWWSTVDPEPPNWNPYEQLVRVLPSSVGYAVDQIVQIELGTSTESMGECYGLSTHPRFPQLFVQHVDPELEPVP